MTQWSSLIITNLKTDESYDIGDIYNDPEYRFDFNVDKVNNVLSIFIWFEGNPVGQVTRTLPRQFEIEAQR